MLKTLPPPNRLRAFEAAARHKGFAAAGRELNLTSAAVAKQVRQLEEELGAPLFERQAHGLRLTEVGAAYLPGVRKAFDDLRIATANLFGQGRRRLTIRAPVSFATLWLAPRLGRFRALHPGIELHVFTSIYVDAPSQGGCDVEIRFGSGDWPGYRVERLARETAILVAPNDLGAELIDAPWVSGTAMTHDTHACLAALAKRPRIAIMGLAEDLWDSLFESYGVEIGQSPWIHVDTSLAALQLVAAGQGSAIVLNRFFEEARAILPIMRVSAIELDLVEAHYVAVPETPASTAETLLFCEWLWREADQGAEVMARVHGTPPG